MDRDEPTAPAGPAARPREPGTRVGRYRIERVIGQGGMGTVYSAFDPDLERRVALKVLLEDGDSARLLREARAMARLQHPNVVMVHEVGTADGEPYVAMELVEGSSIAEWLYQSDHSPHEIVDAFIAAGRGLAAAHAAGLVHRDFKPHNVLRSSTGRVAVTDFGLARGLDAPRADPMATTLPPGGVPVTGPPQRPSALSGLTAPGLAVGTPAYMAPEQWTGGKVGPASDQFAFCVALWEALTGERPFRGTTEEELRDEVARGPANLDTSKLPRRVRSVIVRGLAPKASERWPDMDALLAKLRRAERRPFVIAGVAAGAALAAGAVAVFVMQREPPVPAGNPPCDVPAWKASEKLPEAQRTLFEFDGSFYAATYAGSCRVRESATCLDHVREQLQLAQDAVLLLGKTAPVDPIFEALVDPRACTAPTPPRLHIASGPDAIAATAVWIEAAAAGDDPPPGLAARAQEIAARATEPCSHALAQLAAATTTQDVSTHRTIAEDAASSAERCGDERLVALVALEAATAELVPPGPSLADTARAHAEAAVAHVPSRDLAARLAVLQARAAVKRGDVDKALALADEAIADYQKRIRYAAALEAVLARAQIHIARASDADLAAIRADVKDWQTYARDPLVRERLERTSAIVELLSGDGKRAHDRLVELWQSRARPARDGGRRFEGDVVDDRGAPVAGAQVYVAPMMSTDAYGILPIDPTALRTTVSDAQGHFALDAVASDRVIAIKGDRRSRVGSAADHVKLALGPTRTISGRIDGAPPGAHFLVGFIEAGPPQAYVTLAQVGKDGTFSASGLPTVELGVRAAVGLSADRDVAGVQRSVPPGTAPVTDLHVSVTSTGRVLFVIVRSTLSVPFEQSMMALLPGHVSVTKLGNGIHVNPRMVRIASVPSPTISSELPRDVAKALRAGDNLARFDDVPDEPLSLCAFAVPAGMAAGPTVLVDPHISELEVRCVDVARDAKSVLVVTPPQKRFD